MPSQVSDDEIRAMIVRAEDRMDERLLERSIRAGRRWAYTVVGMRDEELIGLAAAVDRECIKRGFLDTPPPRRR